MGSLKDWWRRLRYLGKRRELDGELEEELRFHLDMKVRELERAGMSEEEARFAALREFGNRSLAEEDSRAAWQFGIAETLIQDIRYGSRTLLRSPVFTIAVIITLALGIGANTALFTVVNSVMLSLLPVDQPRQLYVLGELSGMSMIQASGPGERHPSFMSFPMYRALREHTQAFSDLAAISSFPDYAYVSFEDESQSGPIDSADARLVSGNFFSLLGVRAFLGRTLTADDDRVPGAHPVAVVSHGFWSRRFGADPSVIGKTLRMNGTQYSIVGVAPPEFPGVTPGLPTDIWVPMMMQSQLRREPSYLDDSNIMWLRIIGRLQPEVSEVQAAERTQTLFHQLVTDEAGSEITPEVEQAISQLSMKLTPFSQGFAFVQQQYSRTLAILMGAVGLVLLIACANVGNLLLARGSSRYREMGLRLALGSSRSRIVRQLLTESVILALAGGGVGLIASWWTRDFLVALLLRRSMEAPLDGRILGFTLCVSLLTAVVFGLVPALRATRVDLTSSMKNTGARAPKGSGGWLLRKTLVIAQVAVSLVLLVGAGLFLRSLQNLRSFDTGFRAEGVLLAEIDPQGGGYAREQLPQLYRDLLERVEAIPGVSSASLSYYGLFSGGRRNNAVTIDSYSPQSDDDLRIQDSYVTPKYFETLGVPVVAGRGFVPEDQKGSPKVAVVNETFARHFFGGESPVGKRFGVDGEGSGRDIEIVGVAKDITYDDHREKTPRFAYYPAFQDATYLHSLEVRTNIDPAGVVPLLRRAVAEKAKELPILEVRTLTDQIERSLRSDKRVSQLTSFFGLLALILASTGLYGVMAYGVAQRTNEIGIRTALGANPVQVLWMVLRDGLLLVGIGILVGIPAALASTRLAASLLFGLGVMDPLAMTGAILFLLLVAIAAGLLPARRASNLSPTSALRYE